MALVVENLREGIIARLRLRASRNGRSIEEEVREILRNAVRTEEKSLPLFGSRLRKRFARVGLTKAVAEVRGQKSRPPDIP